MLTAVCSQWAMERAAYLSARKANQEVYGGIRKALRPVSQVLDGRVGGHRRGALRYSYTAGSAGLVDGTGYTACDWGVGLCDTVL